MQELATEQRARIRGGEGEEGKKAGDFVAFRAAASVVRPDKGEGDGGNGSEVPRVPFLVGGYMD